MSIPKEVALEAGVAVLEVSRRFETGELDSSTSNLDAVYDVLEGVSPSAMRAIVAEFVDAEAMTLSLHGEIQSPSKWTPFVDKLTAIVQSKSEASRSSNTFATEAIRAALSAGDLTQDELIAATAALVTSSGMTGASLRDPRKYGDTIREMNRLNAESAPDVRLEPEETIVDAARAGNVYAVDQCIQAGYTVTDANGQVLKDDGIRRTYVPPCTVVRPC